MAAKTRMSATPTSINRARSRISRSTSKASIRDRIKSVNVDSEEEALFLTQFSRQSTFVDRTFSDFDSNAFSLSDDEKEPTDKRLEPQDVRRRLYQRECKKFNVIPVSSYMRHPMNNSLIMCHYNIGPQGAKALSAPLMVDKAITYIDLTGNAIGPTGLQFLFDALGDNGSVTHLNISNNNLDTEGAHIATTYLVRQGVLKFVSLSDNGFKDIDGVTLARIIQENKTLIELNLSENEFGEKAGIAFGKAISSNDRLEALDLSCNHLRRKGAAKVAISIKDNCALKKLNLSFNGFGMEGMVALALAIKDNRTLTELDISHNRINNQDAEIFGKKLGKNDTLKILKIGDNLITTTGALHLINGIKAMESVSVLETLDLKTTGVNLDFIEALEELRQFKDLQVIHGKIIQVYEPDDEGNTKPSAKNKVVKQKVSTKTKQTDTSEQKTLEKAKTDIDGKVFKLENMYQVEITHDVNGNRVTDDDVKYNGDEVFENDDEIAKDVDLELLDNDHYDGDVSCNEEDETRITNNIK